MNNQTVFNVVGILLLLLSGLLLFPLGVSLYCRTPAIDGYLTGIQAFSLTLALSLGAGLALWKWLPFDDESLRDREGFAIVAFSWLSMSLFGALPFFLTGVFPNFIDALFESTSGFTTTGASVLSNIDSAPKEILFWRSMTQWIGGGGIILLSLAIFPVLGIGGFHLFKAEKPGGSTIDRLRPRLAETAKILWKTYIVLTCLEIIFLWVGGVDLFDAICHTFSTLSTGGFSSHDKSVAYFNSGYVESVIILFMFLGGINFSLHYHLLSRNFGAVFKDPELRVYSLMILICILFVTWKLIESGTQMNAGDAFRSAAFTVVSINSTTGFSTDDFNKWPDILRFLILGIMMIGGCHGSTSGSLKIIRYIILFKIALQELRKLVHPQGVFPVKVGDKTIDPEDQTNVVALTFMYFGLAALGFIFLSLLDLDMVSALSATLSCFATTGPGLGLVGPSANYAEIPFLGKALLIFYMLMGRLEVYTIMLLFLPITWRK